MKQITQFFLEGESPTLKLFSFDSIKFCHYCNFKKNNLLLRNYFLYSLIFCHICNMSSNTRLLD